MKAKKIPQRKNHRYMSGEELIKKAFGVKPKTDVETFSEKIITKYA